MLRKISDPVSV